MQEGPFIGHTDIVRRPTRGQPHNSLGIAAKMSHRLSHRPRQHADTNTGTEHHGEP